MSVKRPSSDISGNNNNIRAPTFPEGSNTTASDWITPRQAQKLRRVASLTPHVKLQHQNQKAISVHDVQNFLLWATGSEAGVMPRWCVLENMHTVKNITVVMTPYFDISSLLEAAGKTAGGSSDYPFLGYALRKCMRAGSWRPPSGKPPPSLEKVCPVLKHFLQLMVAKSKIPQKLRPKTAHSNEKPVLIPIADFLMTTTNMIANEFPVHSVSGVPPEGYVECRTSLGEHKRPPIPASAGEGVPAFVFNDKDYKNLLAIDCEMVDTADGLELARLSAVDSGAKTLLDMYVKPAKPVLDYKTEFSGITRESLVGVTATLKDAQKALMDLMDSETILVGHGLENDLKTLKMVHRRIIDTSDLYPHPAGPPRKSALSYLVRKVLKSKMSRESTGMHDSTEDALQAMRLSILKFAKGPYWHPDDEDKYGLSLASLVGGIRIHGEDVDRATMVQRYGERAMTGVLMPDEESESSEPRVQLHVLRGFQRWCELQQSGPGLTKSSRASSKQHKRMVMMKIDLTIRKLLRSMSKGDLLVVFSGCGDMAQYATAFDNYRKSGQHEAKRLLELSREKVARSFTMFTSVADVPAELLADSPVNVPPPTSSSSSAPSATSRVVESDSEESSRETFLFQATSETSTEEAQPSPADVAVRS
ncbi:exonuclease, putative [Perkinsus marinus ATCC 50983]|uniref:Exonuclease, putative n=1 Tax=Perkinsus marinus (strain ATCC 50983 / TXsc) TaxID=423536 RepID=C5K9M5_PERM5|nr:exonuclease, putative [Perkinsus marinus ATCC 50983]EER18797.1 exonuclease, putative [Perkinsus marinus ATCC 50983]|eukprot:XP_002787001.1 exonuclease, putative [Perkinsus marinus ATCC 50983]